MRIVYITAKTPWGQGETFILPEIMEILRQGHRIHLIPLRPEKDLGSGELAMQAAKVGVHLPLLGIKTLGLGLVELLRHPVSVWSTVIDVWRHSGSVTTSVKNLGVIPKGLALTRLVRKLKADHIHAHWASTPATAAYIAAKLSATPWSFTAHRWDIAENNMLRKKAASAEFTRAISEDGKTDIENAIGETLSAKCRVIHMGVDLDRSVTERRGAEETDDGAAGNFVLACPANLVQVKGHKYLIDACRILMEHHQDFSCLLFGDGPLENELHRQVAENGLTEHVRFMGRRPHDELLKHYERGRVQAVIMPSIITGTGEKEGVPVSLMEAMAYGVPVVSTATGGTHELLAGDVGVIVPEKDAHALAIAVENLISKPEERARLGRAGQARVIKEFDIKSVVRTLLVEMGARQAEAKKALVGRHA